MKKYGVIHHSENWVDGPSIRGFDTREEAEDHVKSFVADTHHHKRDTAIIVENLAEYETKVIDQTENKKLYGLREK